MLIQNNNSLCCDFQNHCDRLSSQRSLGRKDFIQCIVTAVYHCREGIVEILLSGGGILQHSLFISQMKQRELEKNQGWSLSQSPPLNLYLPTRVCVLKLPLTSNSNSNSGPSIQTLEHVRDISNPELNILSSCGHGHLWHLHLTR